MDVIKWAPRWFKRSGIASDTLSIHHNGCVQAESWILRNRLLPDKNVDEDVFVSHAAHVVTASSEFPFSFWTVSGFDIVFDNRDFIGYRGASNHSLIDNATNRCYSTMEQDGKVVFLILLVSFSLIHIAWTNDSDKLDAFSLCLLECKHELERCVAICQTRSCNIKWCENLCDAKERECCNMCFTRGHLGPKE